MENGSVNKQLLEANTHVKHAQTAEKRVTNTNKHAHTHKHTHLPIRMFSSLRSRWVMLWLCANRTAFTTARNIMRAADSGKQLLGNV